MASSSTTATTSTNSPCAACKFLRRKCQPECVFAPYFPPDQPQKFANVHKVFGASNVTKLLNELHPHQREDAVNSLAFEADMRLRDPVYGCVGVISLLQHQLRQLQTDLTYAKSELSKYQNNLGGGFSASTHGLIAAAAAAAFHHNTNHSSHQAADMRLNLIGGSSTSRDHLYHHHQFFPSSNSNHHPHQQQQHLIRNFDVVAAGGGGGNNNVMYDASSSFLAMNASAGGIGQLGQQLHQQPRAAAAGDDH